MVGACCQVTQFRLALLSFRGAPQGANPESSNHRLRLLDSGLAASRRPGMTAVDVGED
jgi:hypothetical protein